MFVRDIHNNCRGLREKACCPQVIIGWEKNLYKYINYTKDLCSISEILHNNMMHAIESDDFTECERLLKTGLNPNNIIVGGDARPLSYLKYAMGFKRHRIMNLLIEAGSDIEMEDKNGTTLVNHIDDTDIFSLFMLLEAGADPNYFNSFGESLLTRTCTRCKTFKAEREHMLFNFSIEALRVILKFGGNLNYMLEIADEGCCPWQIYDVFLQEGADPFMKNKRGETCLHLMQREGYCNCHDNKQSILFFKKKTSLTVIRSDKTIKKTKCFICFETAGQFCQLPCCKKNVHLKCLERWHEECDFKSCPLCRSTVKNVETVNVEQEWSCDNISKSTNKNGIIYKYI